MSERYTNAVWYLEIYVTGESCTGCCKLGPADRWRRLPEFGQLCRRSELVLCASWCDNPLPIVSMQQICAFVVVSCIDGVIVICNIRRIDFEVFDQHVGSFWRTT